MHDITGHYNRFDIFDLRINRQASRPARFADTPQGLGEQPELSMEHHQQGENPT
ncbi:hypothetical protein D3C78_1845440 [compost metagenome]